MQMVMGLGKYGGCNLGENLPKNKLENFKLDEYDHRQWMILLME